MENKTTTTTTNQSFKNNREFMISDLKVGRSGREDGK